MLITLDLSARQIASLLRQISPAKLTAKTSPNEPVIGKRPMTDHRRNYQKLLMRKRRAAAKAAA
jgi:hypothetical protein